MLSKSTERFQLLPTVSTALFRTHKLAIQELIQDIYSTDKISLKDYRLERRGDVLGVR